jgi:hypothetical protein
MLDHGKAPHVGHGAYDAERFTPVSQVRDFISNLLQEVLFMNASHIVSAIALLFSGYSLWETSLKRSELKVFVAPVIRYASPYQNTNFEIFAIPVTISNAGARTGTIMSMSLEVTDPANHLSKKFYSANFGQFGIEKQRTGDFRPFAPIPLPGRTSYSEVVQFNAQTEEKVMQIVQGAGHFQFTLKLDAALSENFGLLDRFWSKPPEPVSFEMELPELDHRAFTSGSGTVALHQKNWQSTVSPD